MEHVPDGVRQVRLARSTRARPARLCSLLFACGAQVFECFIDDRSTRRVLASMIGNVVCAVNGLLVVNEVDAVARAWYCAACVPHVHNECDT